MRLNTRRVVMGFVLGVLVAAGNTYAQAPPPDFVKAKEARNAAQRAGDEQGWARYTTDDFMVVNTAGTVQTKADRMAAIKGNKNDAIGRNDSEVKVRVYGDTLIETLVFGDPAAPIRSIGVWVKQAGTWKVASIQQTLIAKK